jgi:hypothetical protein
MRRGRDPAQSRLTPCELGTILGRTMVAQLWLQVEVVGCPTVCRHCWAQGVPYRAMPVADVAWVLAQAHRFCGDHGLGFGAYPMHEVAGHPRAAEVLRLFADHVGSAEFEPLSTTGVPLATREDWKEVLAAAADLGTTTVWVAFHGIGTEHDRQVNRPGAYAEACLAIERAHAVGLRAGCNVFVTTANAGQAERLLAALQRLEVDGMWWGPATYYPTARARRNERLRPQPSDLLPISAWIRALSPFDHDVWANLEAHTGAAWARCALGGEWPAGARRAGGLLELVCRPNLDLHAGVAGTGSGTATCGPTVRRWCSAARSPRARGPPRRRGSVPTRCLRSPSWPPAGQTAAGRESTSAPSRCATSGWTGRCHPVTGARGGQGGRASCAGTPPR